MRPAPILLATWLLAACSRAAGATCPAGLRQDCTEIALPFIVGKTTVTARVRDCACAADAAAVAH